MCVFLCAISRKFAIQEISQNMLFYFFWTQHLL